MKIYFITLMLITPLLLRAQEWVSSYNKALYDYSSGIALDAQENSYVIGSTQVRDNITHLLLKFKPDYSETKKMNFIQ